MSHQQNENLPTESQPQRTGAPRPFKIREYVYACRLKDIRTTWPLGEEYLEYCLTHGIINDVLPPLVGPETSPAEILAAYSNLVHSPSGGSSTTEVPVLIDDPPQSIITDRNNEVIQNTSSHEEGNQNNSVIITSANSSSQPNTDTCTLPSSGDVPEAVKGRRISRKKRSMVDILTVAKHTTPEEMQEMYTKGPLKFKN